MTNDRLIIALDFPDEGAARALVDRLGSSVGFYKIGLELIFGGGLELAKELVAEGKRVFLDTKLLDIGNTVEKATANLAGHGITMLTVHGHDSKTMAAAVRGRDRVCPVSKGGTKLLAVTVMTNLTPQDLAEQTSTMTPSDLVVHRAKLAEAAGFDGVIASGHEAAGVRAAVGDDFLIVTPGIRLAGMEAGDQSRVMTPAQAIAAGATHLVVGRPVNAAEDPNATAEAITAEIAQAA